MYKKPDSAFTAICRLLSRREHSIVELEQKLGAKGFNKTDVQQAIQKAQALDIQNDERFAAMLARTRLQHGYGPIRISMELKTHKLPQEIIDAALSEISEQIPFTIIKLLLKKFGSIVEANKQKYFSWLIQRGFTQEHFRKSLLEEFTNQ
jgi:regulatory protein